LLTEVFDGYTSDTSETLATADVGVELGDTQLPSDVDTQTNRSSGDTVPRKLRSADRGKGDDGDGDNIDAAHFSHQDADNDAFRYPGHIPPLKYVFV